MATEKRNWRTAIEENFIHFSNRIYDNKIKVLFMLILFVVATATNLPKITMDTSTEGFLYEDDPLIVEYNAFRNQFGRDEKIIIALKTDDIFDEEFLEILEAIHTEIEDTTPYIKDVSSLINATRVEGKGDVLLIQDLFLGGVATNIKNLASIKKYTINNPLYKNIYINEDASFTTITITTNTYTSLDEKGKNTEDDLSALDDELAGFEDDTLGEDSTEIQQDFITGPETSAAIESITKIMEKHKSPHIKMFIAGSPIVTEDLQVSLIADMSVFIIYVIVLIAVLLFIMFRRISGVFLPITLVVLTLIATISIMAATGTPISSMTQILPSLLLAVGVGASVHLLAIFYKHFDETGDKRASVAYALGHSGLAILMTSFTTAASLSSFTFSSIAPVSALGTFSAIGVLFALIMTLVYVPAMLALLPIKSRAKTEDKELFLDHLMIKVSAYSIKHFKGIVLTSVIVIVGSLFLSSQMRFSHNPLHWFAADNQTRVNTQIIDKELKGSVTIEVVLDTGKVKGVYNPEFLNKLDHSLKEIYTYKGDNYFIGKIISLIDVVKDTHKSFNGNKEDFYAIPDNAEVIAQELVNWSWDDLEDMVDEAKTKMRISIKAPWVDSIEYVDLIAQVKQNLENSVGSMAKISVTGTIPILASTITQSIESSMKSYLIAFIVIAFLMILLIGDVKLGLIAMLPNLTPILLAISIMVIFKLPLDMFTILIGAIAIGMVVDDTIHFMHNFQRYNEEYHDVDKAIELTLKSTGRAIFMTSIVLSSGFFVFMFASMTNLFNFGLVTGLTVLMAMVTNLSMTAALMKMFVKNDKNLKV